MAKKLRKRIYREATEAERQRQGRSLADLKERTGIERSTLSRLENNEDTNPTITTLSRYADAAGKQLLMVLADAGTVDAK